MKKIILLHICCLFLREYAFGDGITFTNPFRFPVGLIEGPFIGMFIAISVPLNLPEASLSLSYNMEANYVLPQNDSELTYPPIYERSFTRKTFYNLLEYKLKSHGYPGKQCLLRTICEASVYTMENTGVLGDIFHILLTPSSSSEEVELKEYNTAESYGRKKKDCIKYNKKCSFSILDIISIVTKFLNI